MTKPHRLKHRQAESEPASTTVQPDLALPFDPPKLGSGNRPRPETKLGKIISLLSRRTGASLAELIQATGWKPHSTRAALTGLRKRGYRILSTESERQAARYRLASPGSHPTKPEGRKGSLP